MRTVLLLVLTIFLIVFAYGVYWVMQGSDNIGALSPTPRATTRPAHVSLPTTGPAFARPGERPYWERFDPNTGQRTSRLRAERYQPQKDGRVLVIKPEAEFFLHNDRLVRIVGQTGSVNMAESPGGARNTLGSGMNATPRSGDLRDVTLYLFPSTTAKEPELTMTMNNASFDNETFRIQTEAFSDGGRTVPADQVPVTIRGDKYEFDGKGLTIRYNELDRRLEFLQVAHGRRLLIKDPDQFMRPTTRPATNPSSAAATPLQHPLNPEPRTPNPLPQPTPPLEGIALAAADPAAVRAASRRPAPASRPARIEPVYRATFANNVAIFESARPLATAKDLIVDFLGESGHELNMLAAGPTELLTTPQSPTPTLRHPDTPTPPTPKPTTPLNPGTRNPKPETRNPATRPTTQPIEIRWNGPLTIVPLPGDRPERIAPSQSIVRLVGSPARPVHLTNTNPADQSTSDIKCAHLTFWTIDNGAMLESSPAIPIQITDSRGTNIITNSLVYSQTDGAAVLAGKSHATLPASDESASDTKNPAKKPEFLNVDWTDRCTLYLRGQQFQAMKIDRADLRGNVNIDHPQLKMASETLQLAFAPEATPTPKSSTPPLRQVDANGSVRCTILDPNNPDDIRKFNCDTLKLLTARTPAGQLYTRSIAAIGNVHSIDPERDLQAGYVHVALAPPTTRPTTRPKGGDVVPGELESLVAHEKVVIISPDNRSASANQLTIERKDNQLAATLHGEPAIVRSGKNTLMGPIIHLVPDRRQISVTGAGSLDGISQKSPTDAPRPVRVTWVKSMRADANDNLVECFGSVTAVSTDPDGAINTVRGDRVRLTTTTRPSTQPATNPSSAAPAPLRHPDTPTPRHALNPTTRPSTRPSEFDLGDLAVRSIAIQDKAVVESNLSDPAGKILRAFMVESDSILYDRDARRLTIPQTGWLGFMDGRPPATQPAAREAAKDPFSIRGQTVFQWTKSLVYDEAASQITLTGDVHVARKLATGENTDPFHLYADKVIADLEPAPQPTTRPTADSSDFSVKMQFKRVHADGNIRLVGKNVNFEAETIDYDPVKHLLIVRGTERKRAIQRDALGMAEASFDELIWNTETARIVSATNLKASPSATPGKGFPGASK